MDVLIRFDDRFGIYLYCAGYFTHPSDIKKWINENMSIYPAKMSHSTCLMFISPNETRASRIWWSSKRYRWI